MYKLSAADFADTGQWRLLIKIGYTGLEAFLENTLHPEIEPQFFCNASWEFNRDKLRNNIEDAVYNNPRLLDDFATRIILYDPRTLFIPTEIAEKSVGAEEELYKKVYVAENADIMTDADKDITAVWSMAPGIKSFLMRTFPGARITCNLMDKIRAIRKSNKGLSLFAYPHDAETDIIFLDEDNLISASTHEWSHMDDIAYLFLNLLDIYGFKLEDCSLHLEAVKPETQAWDYLKKKAADISFTHSDPYNENNKR